MDGPSPSWTLTSEAHTDPYRRRRLVLLPSATFFEGSDSFVLSFVLALVLGDLGGTEAQAGPSRSRSSSRSSLARHGGRPSAS